MTEDEVKVLMDSWANVGYKKDLLQMEKQKLIDSILTDEVKLQLAEIDAEFLEKETSLEKEDKSKRKILDKAIESFTKNLDLSKEKIQFSSSLMELSVSEAEPVWDVAGIDGYAIAGHPEILSFRSVGKPKTRLTRKK